MAENDTPAAEPTADEISEQKAVRLAKRERLIAASEDLGGGAYPVRLPITATIPEVRDRFVGLGVDEASGEHVGLAGRVVHSRNTGKLCFATLQSGDGSRIQAMVSLAEVGEASLAEWKDLVDLGDHVFVEGEVITSRRGELSIMVTDWRIAAKAILPLPNLHNELSEETRMRSRYLDLIARPQARTNVIDRAKVNASLRRTFGSLGFIEVETPMLQVMHGGASARPFVTHSNAFDTELYLRIAPELYLKRAVVGGIERVYEINRNFRNEGADSTHSPEFAMLEAYEAYGDYDTMADLTQKLIQDAAIATSGAHVVTWADGTEFDLGGEWARISMYEHALRGGRRADHRRDADVAPAAARRRRGHRDRPPAPRQVRRGALGAPREGRPRAADVRHGLPARHVAARAPAPLDRRGGREVGSLRARVRAGHRLLRARRPGRAARALRRTGEARRAAATSRRCDSTRSSCAPSSSACRPRAAWAWASTGCSWRSPVSASARPSSSPSSSDPDPVNRACE